MESEFLRITIRLGKMLFPITVKRREEEIYRAAEKLINERLNFYAGKYQHQGDETYMAMAMLDIAVALKKDEQRKDTAPLMEKITTLLKEIEENGLTDQK
ncbi:cell division protein ZapA [Bacteroides eggerthii]|jgi:cell division protein ZapA|uniref:Cell division protein ZapA n=1 Tax=Bacteroides eggerthii TaxID=28111 RepID=A0ABT7U840_9BACE|nr:cell division protein ZapA [Bacteroides eggerthii]